MPCTEPPLRRRTLSRTRTVLTSLLPLLPFSAFAQETPAPTDVVELSPFEVSSEQDVGYYTNSTLAGTRLNTDLLTTPAAVSVFNEDFLNDINANNLIEALDYSMAFSVDTTSDNGNHEQFGNGGINARGFPRSEDNSKDFFVSYILTDRYNTERLTFARGPNSILFGIGNPGGIIDSSTKRARFDEITTIELSGNEFGAWRVSTDLNRVLVPDKLAMRINLLSEDHRDFRDYNERQTDRGHFAVTYRPFKNTTIRADFERGVVDRNFQRRWVARDGVSRWLDAGANDVDFNDFRAANGTINFNAARTYALSVGANYTNVDRPVLVYQDGSLVPINARNEVSSNGTNGMHLELLDTWSQERGLAGPVNSSDHDFKLYTAYIEQRIGDLYLEAAFRSEEEDRSVHQVLNHSNITPRLDIAPLLPNGGANPNYDRYFIETGQAQINDVGRSVETARLTASYKLETGNKWLGDHQFAGLLQRVERDEQAARFIFSNRTPLGNNNTVTGNAIALRTYLSSPDRPAGEDAFMATPAGQEFAPFDLLNPVTRAVVGRVTPDWVRDRMRPTRAVNESWMLAGQSSWWDKRFVLTYGYRSDTLDQYNFDETLADAAYVAANPGTLRNEAIAGTLGESEAFSGNTRSVGVAVRPVRWLTLTANQSENFSPQNRFNIFNENIGNVSAEGRDFSVRLAPGGSDKLYFVANYFETDVVNSGQNLFDYFTPINQIWDTLESNNVIASPVRIIENSVFSKDFTADGYEFEIVANPTRSINLRANFSIRDNVVGNVGGEIIDYLAANRGQWEPYRTLALVANPGLTVGDNIDRLDNRLANDRLEIGRAASDNIRRRASFFGKYTFRNGPLKGFDVGFGARYTGERIIQYFNDDSGNLQKRTSQTYVIYDLKLGYQRRIFSDRVLWNLRLNVRNLFDFDDPIVYTFEQDTGRAQTYAIFDPRTVSVSSSFKF